MKNARQYVQELKYSLAVSSYENALGNWDSGENYSISMDDVKKELDEAQKLQSEKVKKEAADKEEKAKKIAADKFLDEALAAYEENKVSEAMEKLQLAVNAYPEYQRIKEVSAKLADAIKKEIDIHTTAALKAIGFANIELAEKELQLVVALDPKNELIDTITKKLNDTKKVIIEIGPRPKNSEWDTAVKPVVDFLKANLKDPDSLEFVEWSQVSLQEYKGEKYWAVRVKYRAKNSFGGYVVEEKIAFMQHEAVTGMIDYK